MIKFITIILVVFLAGCTASTIDVTGSYVLPEGLKDCKVYYMRTEGGSGVTVVRCPNSSTTTRFGKHGNVTVTE